MFKFYRPYLARLKARLEAHPDTGTDPNPNGEEASEETRKRRRRPKIDPLKYRGKNDRRHAPRYPAVRRTVKVGWWDGDAFRTMNGLIDNISLGGMAVWVEELPPSPGPFEFLLLDDSPDPTAPPRQEAECPWVPAEMVHHRVWYDEKLDVDVGHVLHLKFLEECRYGFFRSVIHGDHLDGPPPGASPEFDVRYWH